MSEGREATKEKEAKHFLDKPYWLARLTELKDSLLTHEISGAVYQKKVRELRTKARQAGVEI